MKTPIKQLFLLPVLLAGFGLIPAGRVTAQIYTNLHDFTALVESDIVYTNGDGADPYAGSVLSGNTLYGTTIDGGANGNGTVFRVNTDGLDFTNLHNFTAGIGGYPEITNNDGAYPYAGLVLSGNTLYGTTGGGGDYPNGYGTVFAVNTNGSGYTNLHVFFSYSPEYTNGYIPYGGLVLSGNTLYGTTTSGGTIDAGTVFAINTNGTGFTVLHNFDVNDGESPRASLFLSGDTLYGTTELDGSGGHGTVFAINTNGAWFATLHSFNDTGNDAEYPYSSVILGGNTLYGTAEEGGSSGSGTVFSILLPTPELTIILSGTNAIVTWPTNALVFTLQSATNLVPPTVWTTVSPPPYAVINTNNAVTNIITGTNQFYRLSL